MIEKETTFGAWLRRRRRLLDLTQAELAQRVGCAVVTIRKLEAGELRPSKQLAERLAECVEVVPEQYDRFTAFARSTPRALVAATLPVRHNLPSQLTPFVGRMQELADLAALLAEPSVRLLTILGPGGIGKTRLALEAAAAQLDCFADGVYFVSLAQIGSPADLVTAIGGAVGLSFYGVGEAKQQLFGFLRGQALLLVLDNFEHLLAGTPLVAEILAAAPGMNVLITSREKLSLSGETVYALGGMTVPATDTDLLSFDSVQLFLFHAHRVRHDFTPDDPFSMARIAQLTQGMPLGLVLAAAWADVLSPAQIADEISRGIDVLQQDLRDAPVRHRSIRAVFDPTWERLTQTQQDVFMKLSVFRGGFTREAAQAVAGADLHMLSVLAGKSLIQPQPNRRYTIHELLRQYGESHLDESGAALTTHAAHSAFLMDFLAQREADIKGRRQIAAQREIRDDFENIRKAWLWSLDHEQFDAIDRALECLVIAAEITGKLLEARTILQQSAASLAPYVQALWERVIVRLARLNYALHSDDVFERVGTILVRARERGEALEAAWCLWVLADREATFHGRDQRALQLYEELITLCRATGDDYLLAHGLTGVSWRYANNGEVVRAVDALREAIAIRKRIGDVKNLDFAAVQFGWLTFDLLQDAETAEALLDEQISWQTRTGTTSTVPLLLGIKAAMAFWRDDIGDALALAQKGLAIARNQNYIGGQSMCQGPVGLVHCYHGNYREAQVICQEVASAGFSNLTAFLCYWALSLASYGLGDEMNSRRSLTAALHIACRYKSPTFQGMGLLLAAIVYLARNDPQRATEYLAFCFSQPPHLTNWLHNWSLLTDVRAQLQSHPSAETYSTAWERGQTLDLNTEAAKVLTELQVRQ